MKTAIFSRIESVSFRRLVWIIPVVFLIHELEEWNIMDWYERFYTEMPASTDLSVRIWLLAISIIAFILTGAALLFKNTGVTAYLMVPLIAFTLANGLQHLYWLFLFGAYDPGVIFGGFVGVPAGIYVIWRAAKEKLVRPWYPVIFIPYLVHIMTGTVEAGNTLSPSIRSIHELMIKVVAML